jgi:hypothetical protein
MSRPLDELRNLGFPVTWATVRAGWEGVGNLGRQLTVGDVSSFACQQLEHASAKVLSDIADLCAGLDEDNIDDVLRRLAPTISSREIRKWRAFLLAQLMKTLPESPVDGLAELTAFWNALDFPGDMPHVVQGLGNEISPNEYYTQDNYRMLLDRHRVWLRSEINALATESTEEP